MVSEGGKDALEWLIIITVILVNLLVFRNGPLQGLAFFFFLSIPIVYIVIIVSQKRTREAQANPSTQNRTPIPTNVKQYVWRRDGGRCVECGSNERLEYDHIIPVSKGGSNTERNVQLLCEHCNRMKHAKIM